jgi:hypothetical protein
MGLGVTSMVVWMLGVTPDFSGTGTNPVCAKPHDNRSLEHLSQVFPWNPPS